MLAWMILHYPDVLLHLAMDLTGGFTLKCAMGLCKHPHHQYAIWGFGAVLLSILTVSLVG